jgi:hypothetical protein
MVQLHHGITMVQLITMVQMYHPRNHGTINRDITMVIPWFYHGKLYHGFWGGTIVPWQYHGSTDYHGAIVLPQKNHGTFYHITTMEIP